MKKLLFVIVAFMLLSTSCSKNKFVNEKCYITKITFTKLPLQKNSSENWDSLLQGTWPDVYIIIRKTSDHSILYAMSPDDRIDNVNGLPIGWTFAGSGITFDINEEFYIDIYDYDTFNDDDYMGNCGWHKLSDYKKANSADIANGNISCTLSLTWSNE